MVEKVVEKEVAAPLLVVTDRFIFPNILFDYDKADLTAEGLENTKKAAEALKTIQSLKKVIVAGNCDSRGSDAYNDELSIKRADSVKSELEKEGLNASMLEAVGNGERKPIASNDTPKGMAANRRVELEASY
jgi:OOP family OmpA-OmpF porin